MWQVCGHGGRVCFGSWGNKKQLRRQKEMRFLILKGKNFPVSIWKWATSGNNAALLAFFSSGYNRCEPEIKCVPILVKMWCSWECVFWMWACACLSGFKIRYCYGLLVRNGSRPPMCHHCTWYVSHKCRVWAGSGPQQLCYLGLTDLVIWWFDVLGSTVKKH